MCGSPRLIDAVSARTRFATLNCVIASGASDGRVTVR